MPVAIGGVGEVGYGREDGAQVPSSWQGAERGGWRARLANARGSVRGSVGGVAGTGDGPSGASSEDAVPRSPAPEPWQVPRRSAADATAPVETVAGSGGACERSVLRAAPRARRAEPIRLHVHERTWGEDRQPALRSPAAPLRVDVLELGDGYGVLHRELREPERGPSECSVEARRVNASTPNGFG